MDINSEARLAAMRKAKKRQEIRRRITPWVLIGILIAIAVFFFWGKLRESMSFGEENSDAVIEVESIEAEDISDQEETDEETEQEEVEIIDHSAPGPYAEVYSEEKELFFDGYEVTGMAEAGPVPEEVMSENAVLIDADDGTVVAAKAADIRIYPASMTKILTVLVAAEHVTDLDDLYMMDISITDYVYKHDCSAVRDLMYGTILPSGADAALALSEYVAGSEELFVEMMNDKLEELGLSDTAHFTNCIGVYNDDHYCTLTDMAMIMKAATENDLARQIMNTRIYTTSSTEEHPEGIEISNWFIRRIEDKDVHGKVMCAKTGFVNESGCCAASYQVSNEGKHYICVTGNAWSSWRCIYDHVALYDAYTN